ncbi:hypothetical protein [Novosphingobium sp. KN65.2]|uniref:hypothetical protein n=1 Tax=Novosphingobium sp. KN65.2 TaxID=1478134 RepID=UPI0005DFFE56|nr:hypothetical protein [Novosphingobium sp. KN65.2]CDO35013.1 hypothetical protein SPHV1_2180025 [Novosphingobium sp. KN65.2]
MAHNYYAQLERRPRTMTVGQLMTHLKDLDPDEPVVFKSPRYGAFGSELTYTIDSVDIVQMDRDERHFEGGVRIDDETGEEETYEPWTQVFHEWHGVVIS